jgi:hypothetical protein
MGLGEGSAKNSGDDEQSILADDLVREACKFMESVAASKSQ